MKAVVLYGKGDVRRVHLLWNWAQIILSLPLTQKNYINLPISFTSGEYLYVSVSVLPRKPLSPLLEKGATIVMFEVSDASEELPISMYNAFSKHLTIKTSFVNPHTTQRAIDLLASGALKPDESSETI